MYQHANLSNIIPISYIPIAAFLTIQFHFKGNKDTKFRICYHQVLEVQKRSKLLIFGVQVYAINILQQLQAIKNSVWVLIPLTLTGV